MHIQMARDVLRFYFDLKGPVGDANRLKETDAAAFYEQGTIRVRKWAENRMQLRSWAMEADRLEKIEH